MEGFTQRVIVLLVLRGQTFTLSLEYFSIPKRKGLVTQDYRLLHYVKQN